MAFACCLLFININIYNNYVIFTKWNFHNVKEKKCEDTTPKTNHLSNRKHSKSKL